MTRQQYYKAILKRILQTPGPITSNPELLTYVPFLRNLVRPFDIKQSDEFVLSAGRALLDANQTVGGVAKSRSVSLYDPLFAQTWIIETSGSDALAIRNDLALIRGH
jgi:hypothetical protein